MSTRFTPSCIALLTLALFGCDPGPGDELTAAFTMSPPAGEVPLTVQFTDQSSGEIETWEWEFGNGDTSSERNPTYTYVEEGTYSVTLTITGPEGSNSLTRSPAVEVRTSPTGGLCFGVQVPTFAAAGDLDGDGAADLFVLLSNPATLEQELLAYSVRRERVFWRIPLSPQQGLALTLVGVPDMDSDRSNDLVVNRVDFGLVQAVAWIYSGITGEVVKTIRMDRSVVRAVSDLDGGSLPDLVVPNGSSEASLVVISTETGARILEVDGPDLAGLADVYDVDQDGRSDFRFENSPVFISGTDGRTPLEMPRRSGHPSEYLSYARVYLPDFTSDSVPEFLAHSGSMDLVGVLSGVDGMILWNAALGSNESVQGLCGDFDGDGAVDFYTMEVEVSTGGWNRRIYSGSTGHILRTDSAENDSFFSMIVDVAVPVGDLNGDGREDYLDEGVGFTVEGQSSCLSILFSPEVAPR